MLFVTFIAVGLFKLGISQPTSSCSNDELIVDCIKDGNAESHIPDQSCDLSCQDINTKCAALFPETFIPAVCDDEGGESSAYPPINANNCLSLCAMYDGDTNWHDTQWSNNGYTPRWCGGYLCTILPNGGNSCYCLIKDGEYFAGTLDLTGYNNPQITFDYSYVADYNPDTQIRLTIDCGNNGIDYSETITLLSDSRENEFKCEGSNLISDLDNYDYFTTTLPWACANNPVVSVRFDYYVNGDGTTIGRWFGIKNLCVVDTVEPPNECLGATNNGKCDHECSPSTSGSCMSNQDNNYNCYEYTNTCPPATYDCNQSGKTQAWIDKCAQPCFGLSSGPCRHTNFGDTSCFQYSSSECPSNTIDCGQTSPALSNNDLKIAEDANEKKLESKIDDDFRFIIIITSGLFVGFASIVVAIICCLWCYNDFSQKNKGFQKLSTTTTDADTEVA